MNHGLEVTHVYQAIEFYKQKCSETFKRKVSDARRRGDRDSDSDLEVEAATMKLIGNSGYGSLIMDKTKHQNIKYVASQHEASLLVNNPHFRKLTELPNNLFEAEMWKKVIELNLQIQLGYFILQYAKLRMLEFYFDFLDVYIDRNNFKYIEMDSDSAYFAIAGHNLDDVIRPHLTRQYFNELHRWMPSEHCDDHHQKYVECKIKNESFAQSPCCVKRQLFDKRTPGLFKLESSGDEMICLSSKTYLLLNLE